MSKTRHVTQATYTLTLSVEEASDVAMALRAALPLVCGRKFWDMADPYVEMLDACDTYNTLQEKAAELFKFCKMAGCNNHRHPDGRRPA